ncbi:glycosyltransferase [Cupriavidus necator]|uniref:glycosyltransferase n=1 Tax=Cupriavidus necator TaxID=106590 RepID=UPI00339D638B
MTKGPTIAVSIVSHGHDALIRPLLHDLRRIGAVRQLEILLTENLPGNLSTITSQAGIKCKLLQNAAPRGFGANHNAAYKHSTAPFFLVLNPDVRLPDPHTFDLLLDRLDRQPGAAGPRVLAPDGSVEDSARRVPTIARLAQRVLMKSRGLDYDVSRPVQEVDWLAGMFLMFDRASYERVGGFDERYHLYCEDVDICLRLHLAGRSVLWVQDAVVVHDARRQSRRMGGRYFRWHMSSMWRLMTSQAYREFNK